MAERIELPPMLQGDEKAQLHQLWSYLYQMSDALNNNLEAIGGNELTDSERKTMNTILTAGEQAKDQNDMETLKSLIIKTADFVQTTVREWRMNLLGESVASGQFGRYVRHTGLDVEVTPEGITQNYSFEEVVQGLKEYAVNAKNYIKTGLLRTVSSIPVYGVAIGKDVVTFAEDGTETYNDGNKVAELTADELSFWQSGEKIASYTGSKIELYAGDSKRVTLDGNGVTFYYGSTKLAELLNSALKFYYNGTLRTQMDTDGVKIVDGTNKLAELLSSGLVFYNNGEKRLETDANGITLYKGSTKLAELLGSALKFYYNGTLRTQMDTDGVKIYDGSTLLMKTTGSRISFYYNGNEVFYILNGKMYAAGDMEITSGKTLTIKAGSDTWTFDTAGMKYVDSDSQFPFQLTAYGDKAADTVGIFTKYESNTGKLIFVSGIKVGSTNKFANTELWAVDYNNYFDPALGSRITGTGNVLAPTSGYGMLGNSSNAWQSAYVQGIGKLQSIVGVGEIYIWPGGIDDNFQKNIILSKTNNGMLNITSIDTTNLAYFGLVMGVSSRYVKNNIRPLESRGDVIDKLEPVSFRYNKDRTGRTHFGLIYEDTVGLIPEICMEDTDQKAINYVELIPVLLKEIQDLRRRVSELEGGR